MLRSLVGSEMCIRDRYQRRVRGPPLAQDMAFAAPLRMLITPAEPVPSILKPPSNREKPRSQKRVVWRDELPGEVPLAQYREIENCLSAEGSVLSRKFGLTMVVMAVWYLVLIAAAFSLGWAEQLAKVGESVDMSSVARALNVCAGVGFAVAWGVSWARKKSNSYAYL
eukprot:TRINITY_DN18427_c0_g1_i1.p1 TRINITY_DN18427_c0_g1~~TRINITY_DN18427_c0_g1_i1.p1  ORF type:complete len:168 (-),score=44.44 TRINITY_DN18427_c0_g1_i1:245-748(-)